MARRHIDHFHVWLPIQHPLRYSIGIVCKGDGWATTSEIVRRRP